LAGALALLAVATRKPLLAAARRRGALTYGQELNERDERLFTQFNRRVESPKASTPDGARALRERRKVG
jgi:hypothetical protein